MTAFKGCIVLRQFSHIHYCAIKCLLLAEVWTTHILVLLLIHFAETRDVDLIFAERAILCAGVADLTAAE